MHIAAPSIDVGMTPPTLSGRLATAKRATLVLTARNDGNQIVNGVQPVRVRMTTDPADLPAGSYLAVVELLAVAHWTDADASDNIATSASAYAV